LVRRFRRLREACDANRLSHRDFSQLQLQPLTATPGIRKTDQVSSLTNWTLMISCQAFPENRTRRSLTR
jgi:hypothetical protein